MATDIFPEINIPVISIIWSYNGLPAQEMGQRIAAQNERGLTTTVSDIEHIESTSLAGITIIKVFFQPNANIQTAHCPGGRRRADAGAPASARHHATAGDQVLGIEHPGGAARPVVLDVAGERAVRSRRADAAPAAHHDSRRRDPVPLRRKESPDLRRHRHACPAGARHVPGRRGQRDQRPEPDPAFGYDQARRHRVHRQDERLARCDRGAQRAADPHDERRHDVPEGRRLRARRFHQPDQRRAPGRRARRAAVDPEERRRLHARHRREPQGDAAARSARPSRRTSRSRRCSTSRCS